MKTLIAVAAAGLLAVSTTAWAECAGHDKVAQTAVPTITLAPATATAGAQTASDQATTDTTKTTKPGS